VRALHCGVAFLLNEQFVPASEPDDGELRRLRQLLESGAPKDRELAVRRLVDLRAEEILTECLRSPSGLAVQLATAGLWECWLNEEGPAARGRIDEGIRRMDNGDLEDALEIFVKLVREYPRWAEAHNKRATTLYLLGSARLAFKACQTVVELKPNHFGAWNGMALCAAQLEKWQVALDAARKALAVQPGAQANLDLIALAEQRLREEGK
jgi:tetratricopeptide (TPR) repeat protein